MSDVAVSEASARRRFQLKRFVEIAAAIGVLWLLTWLLGWDVFAWFASLWDTMTAISLGYIVAGLALQTVQTTAVAGAWLPILRYAYPDAEIAFRPVLASYATGVALNGFLPANLGSIVMMLMFVAFIPGSSFPGVFAGFLVQKIFFTVIGALVYLYLFLSVPGSFDLELGNISAHRFLTVILLGGIAFLLVLLCRLFWRKVEGLWEKAKVGGAILSYPRVYFSRVVSLQFLGWLAKLGVIGVFLAAYGIPVTFDSIMSVVGGNSLANTVSVTPGGVGVNQAINTISLAHYTDATTAAAYSLGQQLIVTAWNQVYAIALLIWAFGWTGGKLLVQESYGEAKVKAAEQSAAHKERKAARRADHDGD
jgi:uncharacterized membrane protein YbhN (UPF0104 family)